MQMIESILRKSVPLSVLRQIAVFVNTVKVNTVDKLLFSEAVIPASEFILLKERVAFPELSKIIGQNSDQEVSKGFNKFSGAKEKRIYYSS